MCWGAKVPRHFRSRERKFQGTKVHKVPWSESSTYGTFAPGSESTWERKFHNSERKSQLPIFACVSQIADLSLSIFTYLSDHRSQSINFCPDFSDRRSEVITILPQNAHSLLLSVQFSSVYLIPFKQLHVKNQTRIRT